ncbi:MAG: glycosyltransferase family 4 protein [Pseudomonadota bacterium]|nr:glycosyltransferase family 4 protein [Pseudomonadota bacterium]
MKVCLISFNAYSLFNPGAGVTFGGTEIQIFNLARYLAGVKGLPVTVITGDFGQADLERNNQIELRKTFPPGENKSALERLGGYLRLFRALWRTGATHHIVSPAGPALAMVALYCMIFGKKLVYRTAHEMDCDGSYESAHGWRGRLFGFGLRRADAVVTQNEDHRRLLASGGVPSVVIRNGFFLRPQPARLAKTVDGLWVGRCVRWKNPHLFLDVVETFPQLRFVMICPVQEHEDVLFASVFGRARTFENLNFVESVPFSEVQAYFDAARFLIATSEAEGFPNSYLQACMGGTPIISYKVDPDGLIGRYNIGYCAAGNADRLIEAVRGLAEHEADWQTKSRSAARYVSENHNVMVEGEKWMSLIEELGRCRGPRR